MGAVPMLRFVLVVLLLVAKGGVAAASAPALINVPDAPDTGKNKLQVSLAPTMAPVDELKIVFFMPAMGTMPHMEELGEVIKESPVKYTVNYNITMGGSWEIKLSAKISGKWQDFLYSLTTGIPGINDKNIEREGAAGDTGQYLNVGRARLQKIGVKIAQAKEENLHKIIRAPGLVAVDRSRYADVTIRVSGYVEKQFVGRVGDSVKVGAPLMTVYSPDLVAAQSEFLVSGQFKSDAHALHQISEERLINLGMTPSDIATMKKNRKPIRDFVVKAPINGTVTAVNILEGSTVQPGQIVYTIGDLTKSYMIARLFQQDLPDIVPGQVVDIVLGGGNQIVPGKIELIYPTIDSQGTGTFSVRVVTDKIEASLKPGTYADLHFHVHMKTEVVVPESSILYSGMHKYIFVDRGGGALEPLEVKVGRRANGFIQVLSGIKAGDNVVASGNFLLSSEAQLRSALPKWSDNKGTDSQDAEKAEAKEQVPSDHSEHSGHGSTP